MLGIFCAREITAEIETNRSTARIVFERVENIVSSIDLKPDIDMKSSFDPGPWMSVRQLKRRDDTTNQAT